VYAKYVVILSEAKDLNVRIGAFPEVIATEYAEILRASSSDALRMTIVGRRG
jgi:hypothetical protein